MEESRLHAPAAVACGGIERRGPNSLPLLLALARPPPALPIRGTRRCFRCRVVIGAGRFRGGRAQGLRRARRIRLIGRIWRFAFPVSIASARRLPEFSSHAALAFSLPSFKSVRGWYGRCPTTFNRQIKLRSCSLQRPSPRDGILDQVSPRQPCCRVPPYHRFYFHLKQTGPQILPFPSLSAILAIA